MINALRINPTNQRTNPQNFHKRCWELAILKRLVFWVGHFDFFCFIPMKTSHSFLRIKNGMKFCWLPLLPAKNQSPKHFSQQCVAINIAMALLGLKVDNLRIEKCQDVLFPVRFQQATSLPRRNFFSQMYLNFAKYLWKYNFCRLNLSNI